MVGKWLIVGIGLAILVAHDFGFLIAEGMVKSVRMRW